ncbi:hypothetical protein [Thermomonospora echinospora]|uniref:hypothetical protein n=1 Tax=Thermomonospora echinospora TaxID=1992 RepID=UPI001F226951|nr:hypothetical protein [Thermomonospora echinospora]
MADAILYEGYLLYPYRRSSGKNKVRWQFGVLLPQAWAQAHGLSDAGVAGSAESWWQQTECLLEGPRDALVDVRIRFLQVQRRSPEELLPDGDHRPADTIELGSRLELGFDEAVPQEFQVRATVAEVLGGARRVVLRAPGGEESEPLTDEQGRRAGRVLRRRWPVTAVVTLSATACRTPFPLHRLQVRVENTGEATPPEAARDEALRSSLIASHALVAVHGGSFVSLLDPPQWAQEAAHECANVHTFPVLAGEPGRRDLVLSSPILLYDHPRIAPESPGDLHDATEIDEILSLRTRTLTEEEKREARATDPRAAAILNRVDTMPPEVMARLHGAVRSPDPASEAPWWDPAAHASTSPDTDSVVVDGVALARGSRVRLRPRPYGTDPQDRFLDGRTALVEAVLLDVDGAYHLAVTLEDDPAAELNQWYGRYRYFAPDEVRPL